MKKNTFDQSRASDSTTAPLATPLASPMPSSSANQISNPTANRSASQLAAHPLTQSASKSAKHMAICTAIVFLALLALTQFCFAGEVKKTKSSEFPLRPTSDELQIYQRDDIENTIFLAPGHSQKIKIPNLQNAIFTNSSFAKGLVENGSLLLIGKKIGTTNLSLSYGDRSQAGPENKPESRPESLIVRVVRTDTYLVWSKLRSSLLNRRGLRATIDDEGPKVVGRLLLWSDWLSLSNQMRGQNFGNGNAQNQGQSQNQNRRGYRFDAILSASLREQAFNHFQQLSEQSHLPNIKVISEPRLQVLISNGDIKAKAQASALFASYGLPLIESEKMIGQEPMIRTAIYISEIKKNAARKLGIEWPSQRAFNASNISLSTEDLQLSLLGLENAGDGRLLAEPSLLTRSGQTATFHSGGEIPIVIRGKVNREISWKKYGIVIRVKPETNQKLQVRVALEIEVSTPDFGAQIDGIPGISINRVQTDIEVDSGRSVSISGLIQQNSGFGRSGLPWLSQIPVLGKLFSSEDFFTHASELFLFVAPTVIQNSQEAD
jgi:pilus assembly protein CpaC